MKEKPFLFLDDDGEYKIFVPGLRTNSSGVSWGEGQANDGMGVGEAKSLDKFYIADASRDTADTINAAIEEGKNVFFTPGVYHVDKPIEVNKADIILLGTGMASIIPDNAEGAMKIADVDGVTVSGLIFDAGAHSQYLLKVGEDGSHNNHSANPTLLQDLFFRVGGTTNELTKADDALIINSDDTIGDHFWIWRADHGEGVAWDGNESQHGLIVNGDGVKCYALFNEHFQEYNVLWNGDNGATYFFQNETCYDPQTQEGWMSHQFTTDGGKTVTGTVNGYASYKVANDVKNHYAVGLGAYCVFIYTGGPSGQLGDSMNVSIQLDNAIEVPNSEGVIIENACIQTFAKSDGALQKINSIINGVGQGVSSGIASDGTKGEGWSRKFLISYSNGKAVVGVTNSGGTYGGTEEIYDVQQLGDDYIDATAFYSLYNVCLAEKEEVYTPETWAAFAEEMTRAEVLAAKLENKNNEMAYATQAEFDAEFEVLTVAYEQLEAIKEPETVNKDALIQAIEANVNKQENNYTAESWSVFAEALKVAQAVRDDENASQQDVKDATDNLLKAAAGLVQKSGGSNNQDSGSNGQNGNSGGNGTSGTKTVRTGDEQGSRIYMAVLGMIAAVVVSVGVVRRKRKIGR